MASIRKQPSNQSFQDLGKRPNFSEVFDLPVLNWHLLMTNDVKTEDVMTIYFAGNPLYNDKPLTLEQVVEIPYRENKTIKMKIRNISFSKDPHDKRTNITLGTDKIYLESSVKKSIVVKSSIKDFIEQVKKDTGLTFTLKMDINESDKILKDGSSIDTTKTYLEAIDAVLMEKKSITNYTWWIDIYNDLHIDYNVKKATFQMPFDTYGVYIVGYTGDIQKRWIEKEESETTTAGKPKVELTPATRIDAKGKAVADVIKTSSPSSVLKDSKSKDKKLLKYGSWTITLLGHHFMDLNTCVNIKDFADIDPDSEYQLCALEFDDSSRIVNK